MTQKVNSIRLKNRNYNGGYIAYFDLLSKFYKQYSTHKCMFKWYQKIWINISIHFQILFKPLLYIFHSYVTYEADIHYINGKLEDIKKYEKKKIVYLFRFLPIFMYVSNTPSKKDIEIITK